ncbi:MAG: hypothetical protein ACJ8CB_15295 [Ktedonobacteraceae bacterium]
MHPPAWKRWGMHGARTSLDAPAVRVYECPVYGLVIDQSHKGSKNILEEAVG